ncbi:ferric reductase-like transmembrane domain-containing protein [Candidatus Woesearchaeota archaeon]|nr:ferric reductase-like transmembrane domain-containing protein [Candidatus Woesearchaeota archaeon]
MVSILNFLPIFLAIILILILNITSKKFKAYKQTQEAKPTPKSIQFLHTHSRKIIYILTILSVIGIYFFYAATGRDPTKDTINTYGVVAVVLLFITLIPGLLQVYFAGFILNPLLVYARKAIGVSAFMFAFFHGLRNLIAYNVSLTTILSLPGQRPLAIILAAIALVILSLLALTSITKIEKGMGYKKWKWFHRTIYIVFVLIMFHIFIMAPKLQLLSSFSIVVNSFIVFFVLIEIEATSIKFRQKERTKLQNILFHIFLAGIIVFTFYQSYVWIKV